MVLRSSAQTSSSHSCICPPRVSATRRRVRPAASPRGRRGRSKSAAAVSCLPKPAGQCFSNPAEAQPVRAWCRAALLPRRLPKVMLTSLAHRCRDRLHQQIEYPLRPPSLCRDLAARRLKRSNQPRPSQTSESLSLPVPRLSYFLVRKTHAKPSLFLCTLSSRRRSTCKDRVSYYTVFENISSRMLIRKPSDDQGRL